MEHEISGHTRKIYKLTKKKDMPFWEKAKEIVAEICIIVFAVLLAAYIEGRNEHRHEQHEVELFLSGLKDDLTKDIKEMQSDRKRYIYFSQAYTYFTHARTVKDLNNDSTAHYFNALLSTTELIPNNGRFEGFKSSGKIASIENTELQNDIMDLYQENIPSLLYSSTYYNKRKAELQDYLIGNSKFDINNSNNIGTVIFEPKVRNLCINLTFVNEIIARYDATIKNSEKIIKEINEEYPDHK